MSAKIKHKLAHKTSSSRGTGLKHVFIDGIEFKSPLEGYTYNAFKNAGIPVKYEPTHLSYNQNLITWGSTIGI